VNTFKSRPTLIILSILFFCALAWGALRYGRSPTPTDWYELGPNSAQREGISGSHCNVWVQSVVIAPDESVYISWRNYCGFYPVDWISKWDGQRWISTHTPYLLDPMLSETIQITALPDNQLAAIWKGIEHQDGTYTEGIFVGLWDGIGWRVLGGSLIVPTVELGEGYTRWRNNFHLTVSSDNKLYLVWGSEIDGEREVNMKVWDGWKWETVESNLGQFVVAGWESPYMAAAQDGALYLVWSQVYNDSREIYLVKWDGKQWMEVSPGSASERGISQSYSLSENPRVAVAADGALYVSWQTADHHKIKHWDGTMWTEIEKSVLTDSGSSGYYSEIAIVADQIYASSSSDGPGNRQIYVQQ
jgi:hypothetical protein